MSSQAHQLYFHHLSLFFTTAKAKQLVKTPGREIICGHSNGKIRKNEWGTNKEDIKGVSSLFHAHFIADGSETIIVIVSIWLFILRSTSFRLQVSSVVIIVILQMTTARRPNWL